jgi:hypothetical protein
MICAVWPEPLNLLNNNLINSWQENQKSSRTILLIERTQLFLDIDKLRTGFWIIMLCSVFIFYKVTDKKWCEKQMRKLSYWLE